MTTKYHEVYDSWKQDPEKFWADAAREIDWFKEPETTFDETAGVYGHWFPDAVCNTCYNCVDRHVENGRGEQTAIIYDSPITGKQAKLSYSELQVQTSALAAVLKELGHD